MLMQTRTIPRLVLHQAYGGEDFGLRRLVLALRFATEADVLHSKPAVGMLNADEESPQLRWYREWCTRGARSLPFPVQFYTTERARGLGFFDIAPLVEGETFTPRRAVAALWWRKGRLEYAEASGSWTLWKARPIGEESKRLSTARLRDARHALSPLLGLSPSDLYALATNRCLLIDPTSSL